MAPSAGLVQLQHPVTRLRTAVAVAVSAGPGAHWRVELLPGLLVRNRLGQAAECHVTGLVPPESAPHSKQGQSLVVPPGGGSCGVQVLQAAPGGRGGAVLRLWLGAQGGWSEAVSLADPELGVHVFQPQAAKAAALLLPPPPPPRESGQRPLGAVLCQSGTLAATGQACVTLWAPVTLHNGLPSSLRVALPAEAGQDGWTELQAGQAMPLRVAMGGGEVMRLAMVSYKSYKGRVKWALTGEIAG